MTDKQKNKTVEYLLGFGKKVGKVIIRPKLLKEIFHEDVGYEKHMSMLSLMMYTKKDVIPPEYMEQCKDMAVYEFILLMYEDEFKLRYIEAIRYFTGLEIEKIDPDTHAIIFEGDDIIWFEEDFTEFVKVIREQNLNDVIEEEVIEESPNPKVRELQRKKREADEKLKKAKQRNSTNMNISLYSMISAVSAKSRGINKLNIGDLTLVQLYDEFDRLNHFETCEANDYARKQGVENIPYVHWASEIES